MVSPELVAGAGRERPNLRGLTGDALLIWALEQDDLVVDGDIISLTGEAERWLRATDPCVRELFTDVDVVLSRTDVLEALVAHGSQPELATVWLVRCSWLRPAGYRGAYALAPAAKARARPRR